MPRLEHEMSLDMAVDRRRRRRGWSFLVWVELHTLPHAKVGQRILDPFAHAAVLDKTLVLPEFQVCAQDVNQDQAIPRLLLAQV